MDLDRLTLGERLVGAGAAVLVAASFLHWLGGRIVLRVPGTTRNLSNQFIHSAWSYALPAVATVIGVGLLVYVAVLAFDLPLLAGVSARSLARPVAVLGVLTFVLVLVKVLAGANVGPGSFDIPDVNGLAIRAAYSKSWHVGAFIGLAASATIALGAILNLREATTT